LQKFDLLFCPVAVIRGIIALFECAFAIVVSIEHTFAEVEQPLGLSAVVVRKLTALLRAGCERFGDSRVEGAELLADQ